MTAIRTGDASRFASFSFRAFRVASWPPAYAAEQRAIHPRSRAGNRISHAKLETQRDVVTSRLRAPARRNIRRRHPRRVRARRPLRRLPHHRPPLRRAARAEARAGRAVDRAVPGARARLHGAGRGGRSHRRVPDAREDDRGAWGEDRPFCQRGRASGRRHSQLSRRFAGAREGGRGHSRAEPHRRGERRTAGGVRHQRRRGPARARPAGGARGAVVARRASW